MPQNFSETCAGITDQAEVISRRDYVRVTLLDLSLDQAAEMTVDDDPDLKFYTLGLPMALVDATYGHQATNASLMKLGRDEVLVGRDGIFMPGLSNPRVVARRSHWITEAELARGKVDVSGESLTLSAKDRRALSAAGTLSIAHEGVTYQLMLLKPSTPSIAPNPPAESVLFSMTNLGSFTAGEVGFKLFVAHLQSLGQTLEGIVDGFLADERAGTFHNTTLTPWNTWIPQLSNAAFADYLDRLKRTSAWPQLAGAPTFPSYPIALVSVYRQTQVLEGYARGRLVESVTLGPEEAITTEVFTWDRSISERTDEFSATYESTTERERNYSTTAEVAAEMDSSIGANVDGNLGVGLPIKKIKVDAGVEGGVQTEMNASHSNTIELLSEATTKATEKFTATHQVKTLSRRETGTETKTTRTFKNPNLGRTLDVHHFEVIGHYKVRTEVDPELRLALLVENDALDITDRDWIRAHHHFLDQVLLHDVYREGLEAAQILAAQEWIDDLAAAEIRAAEEERQRLASLEDEAADAATGLPRAGIYDKAQRMQEALKALTTYNIKDAVDVIARFHFIGGGPPVTERELREADQIVSRVAWWTQFTLAYPIMTDVAAQYISDIEEAKTLTDPTRQRDLVVSAVGSVVNNLDDDWLIGLKSFVSGAVLAELAVPLAHNPVVYAYMMKLLYHPNDMGLQRLISRIRADYVQHEAKQKVDLLQPPAAEADKLVPADRVASPPRAYTQSELAEAHASFGRLKLHLGEHEMHYRNEFFKREDPALRIQRLEAMGVADYVENSILGFAGTSAIYPLKVDTLPADAQAALEGMAKNTSDNAAPIPPRDIKVTLPTDGITSEVSLGSCDALEPHLQKLREIDLRMAEAQVRALEASLPAVAPPADPAGGVGSDDT